jgi:tetratricopeptide (TPR) repeat protein
MTAFSQPIRFSSYAKCFALAILALTCTIVFAQEEISSDPVVTQNFATASKAFLQQDYPAAAKSYQKVLDSEKNKRTLSKKYFLVLVDNLGMSYGISGKLDKAKSIFDYGLTQYSDYPLFYYNLACTYGEQKKMDEAIAQLRTAFKYKANVLEGETMPDPLKDDSFRYFVDKKEFVDAVQDMQK